jgi:hypothetical protein
MKSFREYLTENVLDMPAVRKLLHGTKVLTPGGNPQLVYHGTTAKDFAKFRRSPGQVGIGAYLTDDPKRAELYTKKTDPKTLRPKFGGRIIPAYLMSQNPFELSDVEWGFDSLEPEGIKQMGEVMGMSPKEVMAANVRDQMKFTKEFTKKLKKRGHDTVKVNRRNEPHKDWLAFDPRQIINAITGRQMG